MRSIDRAIVSGAIAVVTLGCANYSRVADEMAPPLTLSLSDYYEDPMKYDGKQVTVAGYLVSQGDVLHLDETPDGPRGMSDPTMLVRDTTPSKEIGFEEIFESHRCTDRYAKITGVLGQIPSPNIFGMVEISEIRVFEDDAFRGSGEVCYSAN